MRDAQADADKVGLAVEGIGRHGRWESPGSEPRALREFPVSLFGLAAVSGAAAFAFAGVFAFATGVTGLAAALAFTGVLSFAGVGACLLLRQGLERDSGLRGALAA